MKDGHCSGNSLLKRGNCPNDLSLPHAYDFVEKREQLPSSQFALCYVRLQVKLNDRPFALRSDAFVLDKIQD